MVDDVIRRRCVCPGSFDPVTGELPGEPQLEHVSSSLVKEVAGYGGDVTGLVPDGVLSRLRERLGGGLPCPADSGTRTSEVVLKYGDVGVRALL